MTNEIELLEDNKIHLVGSVVRQPIFNHEIYGESFYTIILAVQRLSKQQDEIPVLISNHLLSMDDLKEGTFLLVDGQVRSYNSIDKNDRKRLIINVFARHAEILSDTQEIVYKNELYLDSFICKKPKFRTTPFGREICDLLVAVNRAYKKSDYIPVICWGRNARFCSTMDIGVNLRIWGRFQSRTYEKLDNYGNLNIRTAYEISVIKLEKVEDKNED